MADQKYQTTETGAKINLEKPHNRESDQLYGNESIEDAYVQEIDQ